MTQFHSRVRTRITFRLPAEYQLINDFGGGGERGEATNEESRGKENRLKPVIAADSRGRKKAGGGMGFRANFTSLKIYRQDVKALIKAGLEQPLRFRNFPLRSFAVIASEDHCRKLTLSSIFSFPSLPPLPIEQLLLTRRNFSTASSATSSPFQRFSSFSFFLFSFDRHRFPPHESSREGGNGEGWKSRLSRGI